MMKCTGFFCKLPLYDHIPDYRILYVQAHIWIFVIDERVFLYVLTGGNYWLSAQS